MRYFTFLFLLFLIASGLSGQSNGITGKSLMELRQAPLLPVQAPAIAMPGLPAFFPKKNSLPAAPPSLLYPTPERQPGIYSYDDLALFCKLEVQLERAFRLPVKIRLGDVQYVDWLEGKRETPGN